MFRRGGELYPNESLMKNLDQVSSERDRNISESQTNDELRYVQPQTLPALIARGGPAAAKHRPFHHRSLLHNAQSEI